MEMVLEARLRERINPARRIKPARLTVLPVRGTGRNALFRSAVVSEAIAEQLSRLFFS